MDNIFPFPLKFLNWILSSSLMALILVFLIVIAKNIFKNKLGAKWHYLIWFVLIFRLILPWAPESSLSVFNIFSFEKQTAIIQTASQKENNIQVKIITPAAANMPSVVYDTQADTTIVKVEQEPSSQNNVKDFTINFTVLYWIWLGMAAVIGLYILLNCILFELKIKKYNSIVSREIFNVFLECKYKLNISANISLIETPCVKSPTLVGFINPRLLLPVNVLNTVPLEQLNYVFLHELVHFKRRDIAVNLLTSIILTFHWFNPVIWYAFNKMREDQEMACDALALSYINQTELKEYALTLIRLLESISRRTALPNTAGIGGTKFHIMKRLKMIKSYKKHSLRWSIIGFALVIILSMTSLTNPKAGFLNNKAFASESNIKSPIKDVASAWINNFTYHPENQDEKAIAFTIAKYMNGVGNLDYRTITGREGFEYLVPVRQTQENTWVESTVSEFKKSKLVYQVKDVDIEFIFVRSDEATACLKGKISRTCESSELLNVFSNDFRALFTLKKIDGKWLIATAPQNSSLAQMTLLPSDEEKAIRDVINKYLISNYSNIRKTTLYIPPVVTSTGQITVKCMLNINRARKLDSLNISNSEQEFILQKINGNWAILNSEAQIKYTQGSN